jgi:hypothetical protein
VKKLIAKTRIGKEFMHSRSDAYFADKKDADRICEALNKAKYKLKEGECWYVYDYDFTQEWYVEQVISLTRTGKVKLSYV